jgi:hypothetical protein
LSQSSEREQAIAVIRAAHQNTLLQPNASAMKPAALVPNICPDRFAAINLLIAI